MQTGLRELLPEGAFRDSRLVVDYRQLNQSFLQPTDYRDLELSPPGSSRIYQDSLADCPEEPPPATTPASQSAPPPASWTSYR